MTPNTTADRQTASDIAWMRQLAEEGGRAPMRGAAILMGAGLIYGVASVLHWAAVTGLIGSDKGPGFVWLGATGLFLVFLTVNLLRLKRSEGVVTAANRASAVAWASVGLGIFALFGSVAVLSWRAGGDAAEAILSLTPSIIMVFYGLGWAVTAAMLRSRPLWVLAVASFVAAPLLAALSGQSVQLLAYAAALFGLMALPGFLLVRQAGRA